MKGGEGFTGISAKQGCFGAVTIFFGHAQVVKTRICSTCAYILV